MDYEAISTGGGPYKTFLWSGETPGAKCGGVAVYHSFTSLRYSKSTLTVLNADKKTPR